jgi:hypothetical protein
MTLVSKPDQPRRLSELGALRVLDPDKWVAKVRRAMRDAEGRIPDAAAALQISPRQLFRWLDDKRLGDVKRVSIGRRRD